ncbi:MAG: SH3 domain-containing protein [Clostridia bacterium]|nr:SH3 domain-containing protein [Clostridia bacterium]
MKKATWAIVLALIVATIWFMAQPENYIVEENIGLEKTIRYNELNVREEPNGKIIGELRLNNVVTLTGNCSENLFSDVNDRWVEIDYKGGKAWIISDAINW